MPEVSGHERASGASADQQGSSSLPAGSSKFLAIWRGAWQRTERRNDMVRDVRRHPREGLEVELVAHLGRSRTVRTHVRKRLKLHLTRCFFQTFAFIKQTAETLGIISLQGDGRERGIFSGINRNSDFCRRRSWSVQRVCCGGYKRQIYSTQRVSHSIQ